MIILSDNFEKTLKISFFLIKLINIHKKTLNLQKYFYLYITKNNNYDEK